MQCTPSVSVLMPAHNAEAFVEASLLSALEQDYPADRLTVIVVDDGSTDGTPAILARVAAEHPGRVVVITQPNQGQVAAVNRAAQDADGDLIALLDSDDGWPADKILRQTELLAQRPDVGMVYGDLRVVDAAGRVLEDSWLEGERVPQGRDVGLFLAQNLVMSSTILFRATLRDVIFPIPDEMPWPDWWIAVRSAQVADVAYRPEPKVLYRFHGTNMSLGTRGAARLGQLRKALALQRWFLRRIDVPEMAAADLELAWDAFARMATEALDAAGSPFVELIPVTPPEREEALVLAAGARELLEAGRLDAALGAAVRAAATDPGSDDVRAVLTSVRTVTPAGAGPQPLRGAREVVVGLRGDELLHDPDLLRRLADHVGDLPYVTVAIDASDAEPIEAARRTEAVVADCGLVDSDLDILLVTGPLDELGRARLAHGLTALVGVRGADGDLPWFPPHELAALRELVLGQDAARAA